MSRCLVVVQWFVVIYAATRLHVFYRHELSICLVNLCPVETHCCPVQSGPKMAANDSLNHKSVYLAESPRGFVCLTGKGLCLSPSDKGTW
jgi:hypothetical protein